MNAADHVIRQLIIILGIAVGVAACGQSSSPSPDSTRPWMQVELPPEQRAEQLLAALALEQKFQQLVGNVP